jgi:hypothetical protein
MSIPGKIIVNDGDHSIELITHGELHCVVAYSHGHGDEGWIGCACGLRFYHRTPFEAAKAWYEHRVFRNELLNTLRKGIVAKMGERAKP